MTPRLILAAFALAALAACRDEAADSAPEPVAMTAEAVGHYCQMDLLEHPGPKAQVHLASVPAPLFFSQVRDAIAYQRMPEQSHAITAIYVSDIGAAPSWENPGAENWIAAEAAHYVVGADVIGGMGAPELVPFASQEDAAAFAAEHGGEVLSLERIADAAVLGPVDVGEPDDDGDDADYLERLRNLSTDGEG